MSSPTPHPTAPVPVNRRVGGSKTVVAGDLVIEAAVIEGRGKQDYLVLTHHHLPFPLPEEWNRYRSEVYPNG